MCPELSLYCIVTVSGQIQDQATLFESVEGGNHVGQNNPVFIMTNKTVPYKKNIDGKLNLISQK